MAGHRDDERLRQDAPVRNVVRADAPLRVHRGGVAQPKRLRIPDRAASSRTRSQQSLAKKLLPLRELKDLGPAVFMDLAKFLRERLALDHADDGQLLFEAFYSYLLPQFEGIDAATGERLFQTLSPLMASSAGATVFAKR